jgi:hypothetical protein
MRAGNVRAVVRGNTPENVKRFTAEINPFGGHLGDVGNHSGPKWQGLGKE